jgi:hypothetical protein
MISVAEVDNIARARIEDTKALLTLSSMPRPETPAGQPCVRLLSYGLRIGTTVPTM